MTYTYEKLRNRIEEARYGNALNDVLLLLKNQGLTKSESEMYIFDKWLEELPTRNKLHSNSVVDFVLVQIKKEVRRNLI